MKSENKKYKVLIVDDDQEYLDDISIYLSSHFDIITADNSKDGLRLVEDSSPDCMLLDIQMPNYFGKDPDREGLEFLKFIRSHPTRAAIRNLPIIIISSSIDNESNYDRFAHLTEPILKKPPDIRLLESKIDELIINRN
jgi:CheY-like chemotaxis protein